MNKLSLDKLPRNAKRLLMFSADVVMIPLALWSAFCLRLGTFAPDVFAFWWMFPLAPIISIPLFVRLGLYHAVVRFMGTHAMYAILKGVTLSTLLLATIVLLSGIKGVPRSVFLIYWGVAVLYIGGSRFLMRSYFYALTRPKNSRNIYAIYGAGESGIQLYHALRHGHDAIPVAFIDDDKTLHGSLIRGLKVYPQSMLASLVEEYGISQILLAMPSVSRARRRAIVEELERLPVHVRTIPGMIDLVSGNAEVNELREVEIEDLLGRDTVAPNKGLLEKCIINKNVMITGAGGSIGSELCRQIALLEPNNLIMLDISEYALYSINNELQNLTKNTKTNIIPLLGNVQEQSYIEKIIEIYNVQTIYHAAAYKHVPLVEHNILEAIKNNIFGTLHAAFAAKKCNVETFVLISTDKAVRPTNVMGATKRFAELILQGLANDVESNQNDLNNTHFCMVRFGNVLGSSGSVVPLFREQIRAGGPVTLTHPDIIRYFMTIPEAAQLVIQASAMGDKGEVFVLDMGEPVKIYDLAKRMVNLSGLTLKDDFHQDGDIEIKITGLRPGEKLYEELLIGENATGTQHPRIMQAQERYIAYGELKDNITELEKYIKENDIKSILYLLLKIIDGYVPEKKIKDYLWNQSENDKSDQVEGAKHKNIVRLDASKNVKE
jgi:FlaA1/EpsC-like NDP-sugar epimerase